MRSTGTSFAVKCYRAILVKNTVVMGFFKSVEITVFNVIASLNAFFQVRKIEGVHKVSFTFESAMTITGRAPTVSLHVD